MSFTIPGITGPLQNAAQPLDAQTLAAADLAAVQTATAIAAANAKTAAAAGQQGRAASGKATPMKPDTMNRSASTPVHEYRAAVARFAGTAGTLTEHGDTQAPQASTPKRSVADMSLADQVATATRAGIAGPSQTSWLGNIGNFAKGVGEGTAEGGVGLAQGVGELAKGGYNLATSSTARQRACNTTVTDAEAVGHFAQTAVSDPQKAVARVNDAVSGAVNQVTAAYRQAAAQGQGAEFIGRAVGQSAVAVGAAVLTDGAVGAVGAAARVGRTAEVAADLGEAVAGSAVAGKQTAIDAVSEALRNGQKLSEGQPAVDLQHVFTGEVSPKRGIDTAKGFHHAPADGLHPNARVAEETSPRNAQGVYEARVEISKPVTNAIYSKESTMFPDSMSRDDVVKSLQHAYDNATQKSGNSFLGPSGHGFELKGFTTGAGQDFHIRTGYPVYKQ
jgi:hypothetical protein